MKCLRVVAVVLLSAAPARADFLYKLVGYECDANARAVVLTYRGCNGNPHGERGGHHGTRPADEPAPAWMCHARGGGA